MSKCPIVQIATGFQMMVGSSYSPYESREEEEHKKKIAKLPKSIKLPDGSRITLR